MTTRLLHPALLLEDVQALILYAYKERPAATYFVLKIEDRAKTLAWLKAILPDITHAGRTDRTGSACNIAFTARGLQKLGLSDTDIQTFSAEFSEGMVTAHRQRILGDQDESAPSSWIWGQPEKDDVDVLLCLFAESEDSLSALVSRSRAAWTGPLSPTQELTTRSLPGFKEHFGFHDGISQPGIMGIGKVKPKHLTLNPGEFIIGQVNQYGQPSFAGVVESTTSAVKWLPSAPQAPDKRHLGHNGSYLIFRQLAQDVPGFWRYLFDLADSAEKSPLTSEAVALSQVERTITLAAKMVGRWPDGVSLVERPTIHDKPDAEASPDISNLAHNRRGERCPFSSHILRADPRDTLGLDPNASLKIQKKSAEDSYLVVKHHMILRRGRPFGNPLVESMDTKELINAAQKHQPGDWNQRGLHFLCFNTNISRQFEFIQDTWMNSTKFNGAYTEPDSIVGQRAPQLGCPSMMVPQPPVRSAVRSLPTFVLTRGGAYFFMPSISALHYLAELV